MSATSRSGRRLCKEAVVRNIVQKDRRVQEFIDLGMRFSEREASSAPGGRELDLGKEGGHSAAAFSTPRT